LSTSAISEAAQMAPSENHEGQIDQPEDRIAHTPQRNPLVYLAASLGAGVALALCGAFLGRGEFNHWFYFWMATLIALPSALIFAIAGTVMRSRFLIASLGAGAALALCGAFLGRGDLHYMAFFFLAILIAPPLTLFYAIAETVMRRRFKSPIWDRIRIGATFFLAALIIHPFGLWLGYRLNLKDVDDAEKFCKDLIPDIESTKQRTGKYPENIADVMPGDKPVPRLLRSGKFYSSHDDTFYFIIEDRSSMFGSVVYYRTTGFWTED
jgi:hypothetical protein